MFTITQMLLQVSTLLCRDEDFLNVRQKLLLFLFLPIPTYLKCVPKLMGTNLTFVPCHPHGSLDSVWPEELVSWCEPKLPYYLLPCHQPVNKVFPSCFLTLCHCIWFKPRAANEGWESLATCCHGKLLAVTLTAWQLVSIVSAHSYPRLDWSQGLMTS